MNITLEELKGNIDKYLHQKEKIEVIEGNKVLVTISPSKGRVKRSHYDIIQEINNITRHLGVTASEMAEYAHEKAD